MTAYAGPFVEQATAPTTPDVGLVWYDTTNDVWNRWNGTVWVSSTSYGGIQSSDHGLLGWSRDVSDWTGSVLLTGGTMVVARARLHRAGTIGHVVYATSIAGATLTYAKIGVYDLAGNQLGITGDLTTILAASAYSAGRSEALAAPTVSLAAGTEVLVAVLCTGTTMPTFRSGATSAVMNFGLVAASPLRSATQGSLAALPAPITLASTAVTNSLLGFALAA